MWIWVGRHCGAAGTGVLRTLVAADGTGAPVRGPRAVEAGTAERPEGGEPEERLHTHQEFTNTDTGTRTDPTHVTSIHLIHSELQTTTLYPECTTIIISHQHDKAPPSLLRVWLHLAWFDWDLGLQSLEVFLKIFCPCSGSIWSCLPANTSHLISENNVSSCSVALQRRQ